MDTRVAEAAATGAAPRPADALRTADAARTADAPRSAVTGAFRAGRSFGRTPRGAHRPVVHTQLPHASLDALPVPGLTRRRLGVLVAGLVVIWLVGVFARQVGAASAAAATADQMRARNAAVETEIAGLQQEVRLAQQASFVQQTAHGYGLGGPREISFVVDPHAAPLPSGAPGSVGIRDADPKPEQSPLDSWLRILFGPDPN